MLGPGLDDGPFRLLLGYPLLEPTCHSQECIAHPARNSSGCEQPISSRPLSQLGRAQFLGGLVRSTVHKAFVKESSVRRPLTFCYLESEVPA